MKSVLPTTAICLRTAIAACVAIIAGQPLAAQTNQRVIASYNRATQVSSPTLTPTRNDNKIVAASHLQPSAGVSVKKTAPPPIASQNRLSRPTRQPDLPSANTQVFALPKIDSFSTAASGLAIVVGLFLVCMWLFRRSGPKPSSPLPSEAVAVLGRIPLAARNFAHLLRVGNKLVLVAMTPDGVAPITEITDPTEVQRLLGLCLSNQKHSTSAEFHDVLKHLTQEPASGFLGNQAAASYAKHS